MLRRAAIGVDQVEQDFLISVVFPAPFKPDQAENFARRQLEADRFEHEAGVIGFVYLFNT